jgi:hypothetical protein
MSQLNITINDTPNRKQSRYSLSRAASEDPFKRIIWSFRQARHRVTLPPVHPVESPRSMLFLSNLVVRPWKLGEHYVFMKDGVSLAPDESKFIFRIRFLNVVFFDETGSADYQFVILFVEWV